MTGWLIYLCCTILLLIQICKNLIRHRIWFIYHPLPTTLLGLGGTGDVRKLGSKGGGILKLLLEFIGVLIPILDYTRNGCLYLLALLCVAD